MSRAMLSGSRALVADGGSLALHSKHFIAVTFFGSSGLQKAALADQLDGYTPGLASAIFSLSWALTPRLVGVE